jgi:hypothetical protein
VNKSIPEDPDEAEFPQLPWGDQMTIRVKSQAPPAQPLANVQELHFQWMISQSNSSSILNSNQSPGMTI